MRIIFSRKGFDSAAGGGPSPIVDGRPVSLPIPAGVASRTTYGDLGLGDHAVRASRGRHDGASLCHHDPTFLPGGRCLFGQCGAAQTHLHNRGVGVGDVFLFFGLFRQESDAPHHRIFGYLEVAEVIPLACGAPEWLVELGHPHALALHGSNDTVYAGPGQTAALACESLRLTVPEGPLTLWQRPDWLEPGGLSYHDRRDRWLRGGRLRSVARGQEFVADIGRRKAPRAWLEHILDEIRAS
ncbi:Nmad3 family putative nucleotide modification protein [Erythrobacter mangrovi]|uniref:Nucleotide modification associated domain-containing protein n=1 Tax=Erythrobacter mangrovi TaxID=2739433 RepID=A0A7D3XJL7_9SPHN|nr:hypothetical protein [Erythrobacter mangrovi]QKG72139.1 hypothetical protein HQR01_12610 [Erythrobacter mangrovi]